MSKPYKLKHYIGTNDESLRTYYNERGNVLFNAEDVATILRDDLESMVRYLDDSELLTPDIEVANEDIGKRIVKRGCITEFGLYHTCLNHMSKQVYTREQNQIARELLLWATHGIVPDLLAKEV